MYHTSITNNLISEHKLQLVGKHWINISKFTIQKLLKVLHH